MNSRPLKPLHFADQQMQELIDRVLARCCEELSDIQQLSSETLNEDLRPMIRWHTEFILESFDKRTPLGGEIFRNSSMRRFHQGVSVQSLGKSYEIWGEELWKMLLSYHSDDEPRNSLHIASLLTTYLELARLAITQIYLDESSGRGAAHEPLRPDLLDALVSVDASDDFVARLLVTLRIDVADPHVLFLLRARGRSSTTQAELEFGRLETERMLDEAGLPIVANGVRRDDIVIICSLGDRCITEVMSLADHIAEETPKFSVGISGSLVGTGAFAKGFNEAVNAINYVPGLGEHRVYTANDAMINRLLRRSKSGDELRRETVEPIVGYDNDHQSELMLTLQTFIDTHFNSAVTAERLHVQPNTIRYRLKRISDITGYDPFSAHGIFTLMSGLRSIGPT